MQFLHSKHRILLGLSIASVLIACGCDIHTGSWRGQSRFERRATGQRPLTARSTLDVETSAGSITITGADVADCNIVATITGYAPTQEEAQELAEQVTIEMETIGSTLRVRADKPHTGNNRSISVSYRIVVPRQTNVDCHSSYGSLRLANVDGNDHRPHQQRISGCGADSRLSQSQQFLRVHHVRTVLRW